MIQNSKLFVWYLYGVGFIRPGLFGNFSIGFDESNPYKDDSQCMIRDTIIF